MDTPLDEDFVTNVRNGIVQLLELYSSHEEQAAYPVPDEWACMWFDDLYHPDAPVHRAAFSADERDALARFNTRFDQVLDHIGDLPVDPDDFVHTPTWQSLMTLAKETLEHLEGTKAPYQ